MYYNIERFSSQVVKTLQLTRILDHSSYTTDVQVTLIFAKFFKSNIFLDEAEDSNHDQKKWDVVEIMYNLMMRRAGLSKIMYNRL